MRTSNATALFFFVTLGALLSGGPTVLAQTGGGGGRVAAGAPAREARKAPARGSVSGRVVGEGGEPLRHVAVTVRPRGVAPSNSARTPSLSTDDEGAFVARDLEPGAYAVTAFTPGYVSDPEQASANPAGHRLGDFVVVRMIRGGVITGTVTGASGTPLPALNISAIRVRDHEGRALPGPMPSGSGPTDDRGVYRIYGLTPGVYVVAAGNMSYAWANLSPYEGDSPTFFPSATRDTAAEVTVRAGQEVAGVDIRYREERGRRVTGTVVYPVETPPDASLTVTLTHAGSGAWAGGTWINSREESNAFWLEGIPDGDYVAQAQLQSREGALGSSAPLRVSVRGADVTGLKLSLAPLASASGTLTIEPAPESLRALPDCKGRASSMLPQEALVVARRDVRASAQPAGRGLPQREAAPADSGAFTVRGLEPGAYRFEARPLDENFYARPFQPPGGAPGAARAAASNAAARPAGLLNLGAGQQVSGLSLRLAAGAAGVAGRVVASEANGAAPVAFSALRLHLVPAERERADEVSAYSETTPAADGSFAFRNLAPGRYLLVARATDAAEFPPRPASWDADARARLRAEAAATNVALDLQPCQRVNDFTLRYPHAPGT